MYKKKYLTIVFVFISFFVLPSRVCGRQMKPLIWDMEKIELLRTDPSNAVKVKSILNQADQYCTQELLYVTKKQKTFAPNMHYYCSVAQYWWPDSLNPGQYINKDGVINPESKQYDATTLQELSKRCNKLSYAFYLTKDTKYYDKFIMPEKAEQTLFFLSNQLRR